MNARLERRISEVPLYVQKDQESNLLFLQLKQSFSRVFARTIEDPSTPPTFQQRCNLLAAFLEEEPQIGNDDKWRYLLTGGMVAELLTGVELEHNPIDFLVMNAPNPNRWDLIGSSTEIPLGYAAEMKFDYDNVVDKAIPISVMGKTILAVHPAMIIVQLATLQFEERTSPPRNIQTIRLFIRQLLREDPKGKKWEPIIREGLAIVPGRKLMMTRMHLESLIKEFVPTTPH